MNTMTVRDVQQHITILGLLYLLVHSLFLVVAASVFLLVTGIGVGHDGR